MNKIFGLIFTLSFAFNSNAKTVATIKTTNQTEKVPISIWNDLIIIKAKINGVEGNFIWDNGFSITGLDSLFAKKCGIRLNNNEKDTATDGNGNKVGLKKTLANSIKIGSFDVKETPVWILNVSAIVASKKIKIDGLIGAALINLMNWDFDFDQNIVNISTSKFQHKGITLNYTIDEYNMHHIPCQLNGYDFPATVDFGLNSEDFSANIQLTALFKNNKASEEYGITSFSVSGASKFDTTYVVSNNYEYKLDGKQLSFLPKIYFSNNESKFKIGNRFFRHYNCIINTSDTTYILYNRKKVLVPQANKSYGIKFIKLDNKLVVGKLSTNPNITDNKIQLMSEVISINGLNAKDFDSVQDLLLYQDELVQKGRDLKVKFKDGRTQIFKLENNIEK